MAKIELKLPLKNLLLNTVFMILNIYTISQEILHSQFSSAIGTEGWFLSWIPDEVVGLHLRATL